MITSTDQLGRTISLADKPLRIVSLVPSQTELLYDFGLDREVAGITKFCVYPEEWYRTKTRVGGTKKIDFEKIKSINPDLIIGNKEENEEARMKELMKSYRVWMSDVKTLDDALQMIGSIGDLVGKRKQSIELINKIKINFQQLVPDSQLHALESTVAYIIWNKPIMSVGSDTFINDMLKHCGFRNVFSNKLRYPELSIEELKTSNPDLILLSSEPFPFKERHKAEFHAICPHSKVITVDGELFSWYGSRLIKSPAYFKRLKQEINNAY